MKQVLLPDAAEVKAGALKYLPVVCSTMKLADERLCARVDDGTWGLGMGFVRVRLKELRCRVLLKLEA